MRYPPSLSGKGISDARLEEERTLFELSEAIKKLDSRVNSASGAHQLYNDFRLANIWARSKRKEGTASQASVAKQLKQIASGSATLAKRLEAADKNVFDAWAGASDDADDMMFDPREPMQDWLTLKAMLDEAEKRATRAGRTAEKALKVWRQVGKKGRPADQTADFITLMTANLYKEITGKIAPRSVSRIAGRAEGKFHVFLTDVFSAFELKASPDEANRRLQTELKR